MPSSPDTPSSSVPAPLVAGIAELVDDLLAFRPHPLPALGQMLGDAAVIRLAAICDRRSDAFGRAGLSEATFRRRLLRALDRQRPASPLAAEVDRLARELIARHHEVDGSWISTLEDALLLALLRRSDLLAHEIARLLGVSRPTFRRRRERALARARTDPDPELA